MDEPAFSRVLDTIYDAATSFDRWPAALERIGKLFGASYVGLIDRNLNTMEGRAITVGIDLPSQREYFEVWSTHDVLRQWTPAYRAGAVQTDRDILPRTELLRSDYYNGFMKPRDLGAFLRFTLILEPGFRKILSMKRPISCGDFETSDIEMGRRLVPHLQRAAHVARQVEESKLMLSSFSDLLEQSTTGVLLLDRDGQILFANRAASAMACAGESFIIRARRIEALHGDRNSALQRLIAGATGRFDRTDAPRCGALRLERASGKPDYAITGAPLAGRSLLEGGPVAFLLITDPESASARPGSIMSELFSLSAAEMRLAARLMLGESPEEAAAALNIKVSTARWHLSSLYRKTGTRRQAQLVRLLMSLPNI
jgi:DNA-binding CsgD family transcriptional regulator/PAS domain-containing protein